MVNLVGHPMTLDAWDRLYLSLPAAHDLALMAVLPERLPWPYCFRLAKALEASEAPPAVVKAVMRHFYLEMDITHG